MMELHSYAKRRTAKKWSVEQKRKLVEIRIAYDDLFEQQPNQSLAPWKKVVSFAKLDDYNVFFVRKQWAGMIDKYKQFKQNRLGDLPTKCIDNEMLEKMTEEWEFFKPIHQFMTRKTTNLHSYALTTDPPFEENKTLNMEKIEEIEKSPLWHKPDSNSSNERPRIYSSDTNEDFAASVGIRNDHDFYSKKRNEDGNGEKRLHNIYYPDVSDDTQESMLMEMTTTAEETVELEDSKYSSHIQIDQQTTEKQTFSSNLMQQQNLCSTVTLTDNIEQIPSSVLPEQLNQIKEETTDHDITMTHCDDSTPQKLDRISLSETSARKSHHPVQQAKLHLNERDKYYRHKRRFNRRLEKRFDAILNVFGQIVKSEYPSIDISPLTNLNIPFTNRNVTSQIRNFAGKVFSSSDEMSSTDDDERVPDKTTQKNGLF